MTIEHEEAVRLADQFCSDSECTFGSKTYLFSRYDIAALIADVRRKALLQAEFAVADRQALRISQRLESAAVINAYADATSAIRARLEEGKS